MPDDIITCGVCGAQNAKTAAHCQQCGVDLTSKAKGDKDEIDKILEGILDVDAKQTAGAPAEKKTEVDDLLDSLLVNEEKGAPAATEQFECPSCKAMVPVDASSCPNCKVEFEEDVVEEAKPAQLACPTCSKPMAFIKDYNRYYCHSCRKYAPKGFRAQAEAPKEGQMPGPAPAVPAAAPAPVAIPTAGPATAVPAEEAKEKKLKAEISEADVPKTHMYEGRIIDFTVVGTILALVVIFFAFQMYIFSNLGPLSLGLFLGVMFIGVIVVIFFFRKSTSAISQGDKLVKQGRYAEAIFLYDRAIRLGVNPTNAWTSKGVAYKRLGDFESALKCHNIAVKLNPKNEIAWCNKGDVLFKQGKLPEALECYDKAIELKPKYAIAWNNKGATLTLAGRFSEAHDCYTKAIELRPRYIAAWLNEGEVLVRLGRREEAEKCLVRARSLGA